MRDGDRQGFQTVERRPAVRVYEARGHYQRAGHCPSATIPRAGSRLNVLRRINLLKAVLAGDAKALLASANAASKAVGVVNERWTAFAVESNRRYAKCR